MWRVLVPLDGSDLAASILPDAQRIAGPDGTLILVEDACPERETTPATEPERGSTLQRCREYLQSVAQSLQAQGVRVEVHTTAQGDPADAIDRAAVAFKADLLAVATHGRGAAELWSQGSIAWRALLRSTVPVLLRHAESREMLRSASEQRRILVPLDGSILAEHAIPLAQALSTLWSASIWLVRVVGDEPAEVAESYLAKIAEGLAGEVHVVTVRGPVVETLVGLAGDLAISDIVMTSHGRTGVSRAFAGSIASELIHELHCPIIVLPLLAILNDEATILPDDAGAAPCTL